MGIGGGILNNTFMTLYNRPLHQAVATSAGVGTLIAIPGFIGYIWAGWGHPDLPVACTGIVNWIKVALVIPIALIVTPWGVKLAHALDKRHLEIGFGLFCLLAAGTSAGEGTAGVIAGSMVRDAASLHAGLMAQGRG